MNIDQVKLKRTRNSYGGVDYGAYGILVDAPGARLIYVYSQTTYINRLVGSQYFPASVMLVLDEGGHRSHKYKQFELEIEKGSRLSNDLLRRPEIVKAVTDKWGKRVANMLSSRHTAVVTL